MMKDRLNLQKETKEINGRIVGFNPETGDYDRDLGPKTSPQLIPGRDVPYSPEVQDQRVKTAQASRAVTGGLPTGTATRVGQITQQFDTHPIVKNYNETVNRYNTVKGILGSQMGGPGDLATVFEFMKGLDPTSVVRESEYATAAKSGNIFSGWAAKFNGYLKPEGGFLPENVKQQSLGRFSNRSYPPVTSSIETSGMNTLGGLISGQVLRTVKII